MNKIDCIEDYFASIRAYCLFIIGKRTDDLELMSNILQKECLVGAKVAFISNLMLGIKEDLVDNLGALEYKSKVFVKELERTVERIAFRVDDGYKLSNYVFPDAQTLVAILRNKLAHGKYTIDFLHNRIILNHKGIDIIINVDNLISFLCSAFINTFRDSIGKTYSRDVLFIGKKSDKRIDSLSEVRNIIKNFNCVFFELESIDGHMIGKDCITLLENFLAYYRRHTNDGLRSEFYQRMNEYFKKRNCKLSVKIKKLSNVNDRNSILKFAEEEVIGNPNLDCEMQLTLIGREIQRKISSEYNSFNPMNANIKNIILLSSIDRTGSIDDKDIDSYISQVYQQELSIGYDEFGITLIAMFNALFVYPMDDIYEYSGEYKLDRSDGFDYSLLDLSMVTPTVLVVDNKPLEDAKIKYDGLKRRRNDISQKIVAQQGNLQNVQGNEIAISKIKKNIEDLQTSLSLISIESLEAVFRYYDIKSDYENNSLYFRNRAIIEGIRNAIAHGNYEFISNGSFDGTTIVFNDIYEGNLTFQLKISFSDFLRLIEDNYPCLLKFVNRHVGAGPNRN